MNKTTAIGTIIASLPNLPTVFTTGYACRIAKYLANRPNHFYMVGSMGLAASIGIGVAMQTGMPTVVVDGDGSVLMNPVNLLVAGRIPKLKLWHIVLDDGRYDSTGGQPTSSANVQLGLWAQASGYSQVIEAREESELRDYLGSSGPISGPIFIHCILDPDVHKVPPRIDDDLSALTTRFRAHTVEFARRGVVAGPMSS